MKENSIGNRMKENYEDRYRIKLTRRMPVIIRLDGKSFHTLTRYCRKPFDEDFSDCMTATASYLLKNIQGAKCAYKQSDEISILLTDFDRLTTDAWFDYNLQKMVSVSAGMASAFFTINWWSVIPSIRRTTISNAIFDSRVFNIPKEEVCNYFIWRQLDWFRNSLQMLARTHFSHKELNEKNTSDIHEMLYQKGMNWADLEPVWKNGVFIWLDEGEGWQTTPDIVFTRMRYAVERCLEPIED
ncbi:hypothetical protein LCGC14_1363740 [marine sediment metagenome]|uniref:tRNAHis guanylyltransferase catalytic domain-containing protein n=1 Tax=marine sediment metagenome TaxID=412755 RepID=A0A0F9N9G2_9ZZZZ